jgi:small conductance mechanosensitive channel
VTGGTVAVVTSVVHALAPYAPFQAAEDPPPSCDADNVEDMSFVCRQLFELTDSETVAKGGEVLVGTPLAIFLIFFVSFLANRIARRLIKKLMTKIAEQQMGDGPKMLRRMTPSALRENREAHPLRAAARAETIGSVLNSVATITIYSIAVLMALGEVGINLAPFIAGAGIVGVALGFGAQSLVKDFLSGLFMLAEDQYGVGDVVDVGEAVGTVEVVNLRTTRLRDVNGTVWHVPNGEILRVGNMSQQWARALLDIEVAYDTDLDRAMEVVKEEADRLWQEDTWRTQILEEPDVWGVQTLGASGITIRLVVKTQPGEQFKVTRELNRRMKARFDAEGIEIPFPQQVTWMRREPGSSRDDEMVHDTQP